VVGEGGIGMRTMDPINEHDGKLMTMSNEYIRITRWCSISWRIPNTDLREVDGILEWAEEMSIS